MDKETLSNYGWIVIAVLVLVVMIALATPFGKFVSQAVQSTTQGLFGVNQNALGAVNITIADQSFATSENITKCPLRFGEKYICTTDNVGESEGNYVIYYADGSAEQSLDGSAVTMPTGHFSYTATEINVQNQPENINMLISADGLTVTISIDGAVTLVWTLESTIQ